MAETVSSSGLVDAQGLSAWVRALRRQVQCSYQRGAIVVSGDRVWCLQAAHALVDAAACHAGLWVSADIEGALTPKKACTQLGREYDAIVFDLYQGLDPDALGAVTGTLCGGGLLILLVPQLECWRAPGAGRFLRRAARFMCPGQGVYLLRQGEPLPGLPVADAGMPYVREAAAPFRTQEQRQAVAVIEKAVLARQPRPIVLVSDRGRGKTAALGLAAGSLLQQGIQNIIVTAPRLSVSEPLFRHAQAMVAEATSARGQLLYRDARLAFVAPDALLETQPKADLLLVDEAAAIPLSMLEQFLRHYPAIVFATTIHGYEGTGRGFALKFQRILDERAPGWRLLKMEAPVRWAARDPVEAWMDRLLCLDAELPQPPPVTGLEAAACAVRLLDRDTLSGDEARLRTLFALLVEAHYRTRPADLQHLLDDERVRIYSLEYKQQIVAAALINEEGGYTASLSTRIYRGERRPPGNLLAQTLTFHAGCEYAATLSFARVMRIAVHPGLQGNGLGSHLLQEVLKQEQQRGMDALGVSFGASAGLIRFWRRAGLELVRMGFTRDHASGSHAAVMMLPFTTQAEHIFADMRTRFRHYLPAWLAAPLADVPPAVMRLLQQQARPDVLDMHPSDWREVASFAHSGRGYEACMWPLYKLMANHAAVVAQLGQAERRVIEARIEKNLPWHEVARAIKVAGKKEALRRLRAVVAEVLASVQG